MLRLFSAMNKKKYIYIFKYISLWQVSATKKFIFGLILNLYLFYVFILKLVLIFHFKKFFKSKYFTMAALGHHSGDSADAAVLKYSIVCVKKFANWLSSSRPCGAAIFISMFYKTIFVLVSKNSESHQFHVYRVRFHGTFLYSSSPRLSCGKKKIKKLPSALTWSKSLIFISLSYTSLVRKGSLIRNATVRRRKSGSHVICFIR